MKNTVASRPGRAPEIDAIRGWAAFSVVLFHVFWETFGGVQPWLRNPYTAFVFAGHFDVVVFFILSGDALSFPFFGGGGVSYLQRAAFKRYARLTVPIAVATLVTALAMSAGLTSTEQAGRIVARPDWLGSFARFDASGATAIRFAFYDVYAGGDQANYLPFLWTMQVELSGSFFLFLLLFVMPKIKGAAWLIAGLAFVLIDADSYFGCFLIGLLLGKARSCRAYDVIPPEVGRWVSAAGLLLVMVGVSRQQRAADPDLRDVAGLATIALLCLYANPSAVRFLARHRFSQFLGRISYPLYLWHYIVLITMTSHLIVVAARHHGRVSPLAAVAIGAGTVLVSMVVAWATLPVEGWAQRINGFLLRLVWQDETHDPPPRYGEAATASEGSNPDAATTR